jgi:hypothetical protein
MGLRAPSWDRRGGERMASWWKRRDRDASATVQRLEARLDQPVALEELLEPLPESAELRPRLNAVLFVRAWDAEARRDYWVRSDGNKVVCFALSGLTLQQAAAVRVRWDAKHSAAQLSEEALADVVAKLIGAPVTLVGGGE